MKTRRVMGLPLTPHKKGGPVIPSSIKKHDGEQPDVEFVGRGLVKRTAEECEREGLNPNPNPSGVINLPDGPAALKAHIRQEQQQGLLQLID